MREMLGMGSDLVGQVEGNEHRKPQVGGLTQQLSARSATGSCH
jgi:hypothetical protein